MLTGVSPTLNDTILYKCLLKKKTMSAFQMSIGSTNVSQLDYLVEEQAEGEEVLSDKDNMDNEDDTDIINNLYTRAIKGDYDLDEIMVSVTDFTRTCKVDAKM